MRRPAIAAGVGLAGFALLGPAALAADFDAIAKPAAEVTQRAANGEVWALVVLLLIICAGLLGLLIWRAYAPRAKSDNTAAGGGESMAEVVQAVRSLQRTLVTVGEELEHVDGQGREEMRALRAELARFADALDAGLRRVHERIDDHQRATHDSLERVYGLLVRQRPAAE